MSHRGDNGRTKLGYPPVTDGDHAEPPVMSPVNPSRTMFSHPHHFTQLTRATLSRESCITGVGLVVWHRTLANSALWVGPSKLRVRFLDLVFETHPCAVLHTFTSKVSPMRASLSCVGTHFFEPCDMTSRDESGCSGSGRVITRSRGFNKCPTQRHCVSSQRILEHANHEYHDSSNTTAVSRS